MEKRIKNVYPYTIRRYVDAVGGQPVNWSQYINAPFSVDEVIVKNFHIESVNPGGVIPTEIGVIITDLPLKYTNELCIWYHPANASPQLQYLNRKFKTSNDNINGNYSFQMLGHPLTGNGPLVSPIVRCYLMILIEFVEYEK